MNTTASFDGKSLGGQRLSIYAVDIQAVTQSLLYGAEGQGQAAVERNQQNQAAVMEPAA
ncbi:MAG TPA: hypothetical protein VMV72_19320 [Verrucomicrobiae bacterium]|nr:hypothetical protein [Verrucomicrobiae bacterium]